MLELSITSTAIDTARHFLAQYQHLAPEQRVTELFAPDVLVADPQSSRSLPRRYVALGMKHREEEFERIGLTGTTLSNWSVLELGPRFLLVRSSWALEFDHATAGPSSVHLDSDFLLQKQREEVKCIAYLARQDVAQELTCRGLR